MKDGVAGLNTYEEGTRNAGPESPGSREPEKEAKCEPKLSGWGKRERELCRYLLLYKHKSLITTCAGSRSQFPSFSRIISRFPSYFNVPTLETYCPRLIIFADFLNPARSRK